MTALPVASTLPLHDVQGVILRGFRSFNHVRHMIFNIAGDGSGAQKLCKLLVPGSGAAMTVTAAAPWSVKPDYCLNVGMTKSGLTKLIGANYATLVNDCSTLMTPYDRDPNQTAAINGDTGPSAPPNWWQNGGWMLEGEKPSSDPLDLLITLYTPDDASRQTFTKALLDMIPPLADGTPSVRLAFQLDCDPLDPPDSIHFGYVDGIAQPRVQGFDDPTPADDRPMVPASYFVIDPVTGPYWADPFLVNGGFGAFRLLYQDVEKFQSYVGAAGDETAQELLMAKMCGRWRDGTPIEVAPDAPDPSIQGFTRNNFNYKVASPNQQNPATPDMDTFGQRCPYASHIRRTNPRDDDSVHFNIDEAKIHRVMRRAFAYGPPFASAPSAQRGLAGLFMGAVLTDQFEFLMQTWMSAGGFRTPDLSPNASGCDPLFGPQPGGSAALDAFDCLPDSATLPPTSADYDSTPGLDRFVRTDGSLYVFLPSMHALTLMSTGAIA